MRRRLPLLRYWGSKGHFVVVPFYDIWTTASTSILQQCVCIRTVSHLSLRTILCCINDPLCKGEVFIIIHVFARSWVMTAPFFFAPDSLLRPMLTTSWSCSLALSSGHKREFGWDWRRGSTTSRDDVYVLCTTKCTDRVRAGGRSAEVVRPNLPGSIHGKKLQLSSNSLILSAFWHVNNLAIILKPAMNHRIKS